MQPGAHTCAIKSTQTIVDSDGKPFTVFAPLLEHKTLYSQHQAFDIFVDGQYACSQRYSAFENLNKQVCVCVISV